MRVRLATPDDAASLARIYNEGIEDRTATFETRPRTEEDVLAWLDGVHPVIAVEDEGAVIAFARASEYRPRECYQGVFEFAVYTDRRHRRRGAGTAGLRELVTQARAGGAWKLLARIFVENAESRALVAALGFREVGVYYRHAKLDGKWRDVVVVEKFLAPIGAAGSIGPGASRGPREQILAHLASSAADERAQGLEWARSHLAVFRRTDPELLAAAVDAFLASKQDTATRGAFVELFRAYAALGAEAEHAVAAALLDRLERRALPADIDVFYEVAFVVRQIFGAAAGGATVPALVPHVGRLLEWVRQAIDLPPTLRGRISPGNLASLLTTLAIAACTSDTQRQHVGEVAAAGRARHRVEPPAVIRTPSRPPPPLPPPLPPMERESIVDVSDDAIEIVGDEETLPLPPVMPVMPVATAEEAPKKKKRAGKRTKRAKAPPKA